MLGITEKVRLKFVTHFVSRSRHLLANDELWVQAIWGEVEHCSFAYTSLQYLMILVENQKSFSLTFWCINFFSIWPVCSLFNYWNVFQQLSETEKVIHSAQLCAPTSIATIMWEFFQLRRSEYHTCNSKGNMFCGRIALWLVLGCCCEQIGISAHCMSHFSLDVCGTLMQMVSLERIICCLTTWGWHQNLYQHKHSSVKLCNHWCSAFNGG